MNSKKPLDVRVILNESYIKTIRNSVGSNLFRNLYAHVNGKKKDVLRDGVLSCATFVSSILHLFKLIAEVHATVDGTVTDLKKSGWRKIKKPREGAVIVWGAQRFGNNETHKHIGFYIAQKRAASNSYKKRQPVLHHWTFGIKNSRPVRKVEQIFWNKKLEKKQYDRRLKS